MHLEIEISEGAPPQIFCNFNDPDFAGLFYITILRRGLDAEVQRDGPGQSGIETSVSTISDGDLPEVRISLTDIGSVGQRAETPDQVLDLLVYWGKLPIANALAGPEKVRLTCFLVLLHDKRPPSWPTAKGRLESEPVQVTMEDVQVPELL